MGLNHAQRLALNLDSHLVVDAGAGTGKTRVLTSRFVYIVKNLKFDFNRIIAVTFTNKAAKERKRKRLALNKQLAKVGRTSKQYKKYMKKNKDTINTIRRF